MSPASVPTVAVLIVAAGTGERFGATLPKQYQPLLGKPVLRWSIDAFKNHPAIASVHVVIHPDHLDIYQRTVEGLNLPTPVLGGKTRQASVLLGLEAIAKSSGADFVLIHDAARPAVDAALISDICAALQDSDAVVPSLAIADTLRRGNKTESRDGLFAVQTPQAFHFKEILELHRKYKDTAVTDDASLCDLAGIPVKIIGGRRGNIKITQSDDFSFIEQTLSAERADVRTGFGYDVHRFSPQQPMHRKLKIGGVEIQFDKVLEGHSDADVALHAVTDALLATICDGDIGMHFSPKDARWKNADSAVFLRHAAEKIFALGGAISHIDATIICEEPKIGPHRDRIRTRIGDILSLPVNRVSIKATTTEGLGFTGRSEGIAAQAVATVRLPFGCTDLSKNIPLAEKKEGYG